MFHGRLKAFALEQLDQRRRHEGRDDRHALPRCERVHAGADQRKRFFAAREVRTNIEGFENDRIHSERARLIRRWAILARA